jgi:hypothetical protein
MFNKVAMLCTANWTKKSWTRVVQHTKLLGENLKPDMKWRHQSRYITSQWMLPSIQLHFQDQRKCWKPVYFRFQISGPRSHAHLSIAAIHSFVNIVGPPGRRRFWCNVRVRILLHRNGDAEIRVAVSRGHQIFRNWGRVGGELLWGF